MAASEVPQSAAAYEQLREWIVVGELEPGSLVTERGLMAATGFGKTPVREALARLVSDRFVTPLPRRGYEITPLTLADVDELLELWRIVGPATARLACVRNGPGVLAALGRPVRRMRNDLEAGRRFFGLLADASGNERLVEANRKLFQDLYRYFFLAYRDRAPKDWLVDDLGAMRAALAAGDVEGAVAAYTRSIDHGAAELHAILSTLPSVRRVPLTA